ncbi:hypothetical protein EWM64_g9218 [Hericium alpestre]|uniref:Uncharacterized protein n=1 Tax=Hericium alpestre TaxID=135208 RepID=A0A4Y9ZLG2_9AGAM|nr:hypothetical protein EWM64_g9218 [Hericium alpestre]
MFSSKTAGTGFIENEADSDHKFAIPGGTDISVSVDELGAAAGSEPVEMGHRKRLKRQNQLYSDENLKFWEA